MDNKLIEDIEKELRDQYEPLLYAVASSKSLINDFINIIKTYNEEYKLIIEWIIKEKAKHKSLYLNSLIDNGFSRDESMKFVLDQKDEFYEIFKNINIKGNLK